MSDTEHHLGRDEQSSIATSSDGVATDATITARCKWFNNKAGYGFVTVSGGEHDGTDVFVHHSGIVVDKEQYRYLVQGEYVELTMTETNEGQHKWQANDIRGINGGILMCETRNEVRETREDGEDGEDASHHSAGDGRTRHSGGQGGYSGGGHGRGGSGGHGRGGRGGYSGGGHGRDAGGANVQRYRVRGPGPRENSGTTSNDNEVWELVRTTRGGEGRSDHA